MGTLKRVRLLPRSHKPRRVLSDWFAVRVKAGRERYAVRNVIMQGHRAIVPFVEEEYVNREKPLFKGYIFVQGPAWYYLLSTYGCLHPIMMGEEPSCMPLQEMKGILSLVTDKRDGGIIPLKAPKYKKGQVVTIERGSLKNFEAVYIRGTKADRVKLQVAMFGGTHEVEYARRDISPRRKV
jgi:transcription antitermination factor NusG